MQPTDLHTTSQSIWDVFVAFQSRNLSFYYVLNGQLVIYTERLHLRHVHLVYLEERLAVTRLTFYRQKQVDADNWKWSVCWLKNAEVAGDNVIRCPASLEVPVSTHTVTSKDYSLDYYLLPTVVLFQFLHF